MTIRQMVACRSKGKGYFHIWYLYTQATLQLLQVEM